jgi:hypothetical protein
VPELLARHLVMVVGAQAADVAVNVLASESEGLDVIRHGGFGRPAFSLAHAAEGLVVQAALAEGYSSATSDALVHRPG